MLHDDDEKKDESWENVKHFLFNELNCNLILQHIFYKPNYHVVLVYIT